MSKTDKTNPYWVQIRRREGAVKGFYEHHRCVLGRPCNLGEPLPVTRSGVSRVWNPERRYACEIWPKYSENNMIFGRRPKRSTRKAYGFEGAIRAELRRLRRQWAYEPDRESIDSSWGAPRRRCQVRDPWHWD